MRPSRCASFLAALLLVEACQPTRPSTTRRSVPGVLAEALDAGASTWSLAPESDPMIVRFAPVDIGSASCAGLRVLRVDRRRPRTGAPPIDLPARFFGRDEYGRDHALSDVLLCELRAGHFAIKPRPEGIFLLLWRGPAILRPDALCEWREPAETEVLASGDRRVHFDERCREGSAGVLSSPRRMAVDVAGDYTSIAFAPGS